MTLIELCYIVELAETRHFGRAAERCNVSQPTLSMAVKKLEEELGVMLFERTKTGVHLTLMGEPFIEQARVILRRVADIHTLAEAGQDQLHSTLRLGVVTSAAPYLLPQLIPYLQQQVATMPLHVYEDMTANLREKLRTGAVDAILVSLPFTEVDVVVQELYEEPLVAVMAQTHPLAALTCVDAATLDGQTLLLLAEGHCLRDQTLALFPEIAQRPEPRIYANSLETLRGMVAAGLGVAVVPRSAATPGICMANRLVARPLAMPGASRTLALAWRASFPRHKAIDVVRKAIQACSGAYWSFTTEPESLGQAMFPTRHY